MVPFFVCASNFLLSTNKFIYENICFVFSKERLTNEFRIIFFFAVPNIESYPPIEAIVIGDQLQLLQLPESDIKVQSKQEEASEAYCNISRFNTLEVAYNDEIFVTTNTSSTMLFELSNTNKVSRYIIPQKNCRINYMTFHAPTTTYNQIPNTILPTCILCLTYFPRFVVQNIYG